LSHRNAQKIFFIILCEVTGMKTAKRKAYITLDVDTVIQISVFAKQDNLSFSEYVSTVLRVWLENHLAEKQKETRHKK